MAYRYIHTAGSKTAKFARSIHDEGKLYPDRRRFSPSIQRRKFHPLSRRLSSSRKKCAISPSVLLTIMEAVLSGPNRWKERHFCSFNQPEHSQALSDLRFSSLKGASKSHRSFAQFSMNCQPRIPRHFRRSWCIIGGKAAEGGAGPSCGSS